MSFAAILAWRGVSFVGGGVVVVIVIVVEGVGSIVDLVLGC